MHNTTQMTRTCPHFNDCGGCDFQDKPYDEQLRLKEEYLKGLLCEFPVERMERIVPSPDTWYYRNKMEYIVGPSETGPAIGLRRKRRFHKIVDLKECKIFCKDIGKIFNLFKRWMADYAIEPYNLFKHRGTVRYLALRHSKFRNELMAIVVVSSSAERFHENKVKYTELAERLKDVGNVKSLYVSINNRLADTTASLDLFLIYGEPFITERIGGIDYLVGPSTFFQTNSLCCERLYMVIKDEASSFGRSVAIDIYCGSGGIALQIADRVEKVIGVDIAAKNIDHASRNARLNRIDNTEFIASEAGKFLKGAKISGLLDKNVVVIVDPPRAGLSKETRAALLEAGPRNIIYVSCNPKSLKADLKEFLTLYEIKKIIPVDMFPHTRHMEIVANLEKQTPGVCIQTPGVCEG